jgi:hypothetical protein
MNMNAYGGRTAFALIAIKKLISHGIEFFLNGHCGGSTTPLKA